MPRPAIHPGEILANELENIGVTPIELSREIAVPPRPPHLPDPREASASRWR